MPVHRDDYINDSVKIFIFQNRLEIVRSDKLPWVKNFPSSIPLPPTIFAHFL